jgi:hypothetical protein
MPQYRTLPTPVDWLRDNPSVLEQVDSDRQHLQLFLEYPPSQQALPVLRWYGAKSAVPAVECRINGTKPTQNGAVLAFMAICSILRMVVGDHRAHHPCTRDLAQNSLEQAEGDLLCQTVRARIYPRY